MGLPTDEGELREKLKTVISPSRPITTPEFLNGRSKNLRTISRALNNPGRHIFIYGDRGVGKTSLAQTAARLEQSSDSDPIVIGCDVSSTFNQIARDLFRRCMAVQDLFARKNEREKISGGMKFLSKEIEVGLEKGIVPDVSSVNEAADIIRYICFFHSASPVVVIDEFDQISDEKERKLFAQFLKQLSDQEISIKIILCGIGGSVETLLGAHWSTDRLITPINLERLSLDAIWKIAIDALAAFDLELPSVMKTRIGQICDGFPYYAHLIAEHMIWAIYDSKNTSCLVGEEEYHEGIRGAIADSQNALKTAYEAAVVKQKDDYEEVLWAFADSSLLRVQVTDAFATYEKMMEGRSHRKKVARSTFDNRVSRLKTEAHGSILAPHGGGWYTFRENILRGYVRLRAEREGMQLGADHIGPTKLSEQANDKSPSYIHQG